MVDLSHPCHTDSKKTVHHSQVQEESHDHSSQLKNVKNFEQIPIFGWDENFKILTDPQKPNLSGPSSSGR